jgi:hypothetical protein
MIENPIKEGGYHIGWYKIFPMYHDLEFGIRTAKYNQMLDPNRLWEGLVLCKSEIDIPKTESVQLIKGLSGLIKEVEVNYSDNRKIKTFLFLEKDFDKIYYYIKNRFKPSCSV